MLKKALKTWKRLIYCSIGPEHINKTYLAVPSAEHSVIQTYRWDGSVVQTTVGRAFKEELRAPKELLKAGWATSCRV